MSYDAKGVLKQLIEDGEEFKGQLTKDEYGNPRLSGEDYEKWIAKGIIFLERCYSTGTATKRFLAAADQAVDNNPSYLDTMLGVLKAILEMEE